MRQINPKFKGTADDALDLLIDDLVDVLDYEGPQEMERDGERAQLLVSADKTRRFWTDAGIIGSESFVRKRIAEMFGKERKDKQKIGFGVLADGTKLYGMRRIRCRPSHGDIPPEENEG
jgi:hypothetical protein